MIQFGWESSCEGCEHRMFCMSQLGRTKRSPCYCVLCSRLVIRNGSVNNLCYCPCVLIPRQCPTSVARTLEEINKIIAFDSIEPIGFRDGDKRHFISLKTIVATPDNRMAVIRLGMCKFCSEVKNNEEKESYP